MFFLDILIYEKTDTQLGKYSLNKSYKRVSEGRLSAIQYLKLFFF